MQFLCQSQTGGLLDAVGFRSIATDSPSELDEAAGANAAASMSRYFSAYIVGSHRRGGLKARLVGRVGDDLVEVLEEHESIMTAVRAFGGRWIQHLRLGQPTTSDHEPGCARARRSCTPLRSQPRHESKSKYKVCSLLSAPEIPTVRFRTQLGCGVAAGRSPDMHVSNASDALLIWPLALLLLLSEQKPGGRLSDLAVPTLMLLAMTGSLQKALPNPIPGLDGPNGFLSGLGSSHTIVANNGGSGLGRDRAAAAAAVAAAAASAAGLGGAGACGAAISGWRRCRRRLRRQAPWSGSRRSERARAARGSSRRAS